MKTEFSIFPALETERLSLRRLSPADAQAIYELRSQAEVARLTGKEPFKGIDEATAYIQKIEKLYKEAACVFWAISYKGQSALIGTICFWNFDSINNYVEIGYELLPGFQKKGIMWECISTVINFGFKNMGVDAITAFPSAHNPASVSVLEKLNFKLVPDTLQHNHQNIDAVLSYVLDNFEQEQPTGITEQ